MSHPDGTASVKSLLIQELRDGMDPNVLWTEEDVDGPNLDPYRSNLAALDVPDSEAWAHYNTPLHKALRSSDTTTAEVALAQGADINLYNSLGQTPLHEAVRAGNDAAITFLLNHGAQVDKGTKATRVRWERLDKELSSTADETCLQLALFKGDSEALRLLLEAGAASSPDVQRPWTALDLAILCRDQGAVDIALEQQKRRGDDDVDVQRHVKQPYSSAGAVNLSRSDFVGPARSLLDLVTTKRLSAVPPQPLYESYRHARQFSQDNYVWKLGLMNGFYAALLDVAGISELRNQRTDMLCPRCRAFQTEVAGLFENEHKALIKFTLYDNRAALDASADTGCQLCAITADAIDHAISQTSGQGSDSGPTSTSSPLPIILEAELDSPDSSYVQLSASCGELRGEMTSGFLRDLFLPFSENHHKPDNSTGSAGALQTARVWLHACKTDESHFSCQNAVHKPDSSDDLPKRLLYVGSKELHIVEIHGATSPYCALSYCRGTGDLSPTTRANLPLRLAGISLDTLPALFRDAVHVTQELGYQYLWIDAICIVQDDEEDCRQEAAKASAIYANADLTISTLVASDCSESLFTPRPMRATRPVPLDLGCSISRLTPGVSQAIFPRWPQGSQETLRGPVHTRGWTLQEQLVSTRILWFAHGTIHWECLEGYRVEQNFWEKYKEDDRLRKCVFRDWHNTRAAVQAVLMGKTTQNHAPFQDLWPPSDELLPFHLWKAQVEEFTRRSISRPTDRDAAMASLSVALAKTRGSHVTHGVWTGDRLLESLGWCVTSPEPHNVGAAVPSWTWQSVPGQISFQLVSRGGRGGVDIIPGCALMSFGSANDGPYPRSSVTLRGRLCRKRPLRRLLDAWRDGSPSSKDMGPWKSSVSGIYPDRALQSIDVCYSVDLFAFPLGPPTQAYGRQAQPEGPGRKTIKLLLEPVDSDRKVFRRVGVGRVAGITFQKGKEAVARDEDLAPMGDDDGAWPYQWMKRDEEVFEEVDVCII